MGFLGINYLLQLLLNNHSQWMFAASLELPPEPVDLIALKSFFENLPGMPNFFKNSILGPPATLYRDFT